MRRGTVPIKSGCPYGVICPEKRRPHDPKVSRGGVKILVVRQPCCVEDSVL